MQNIKEVLRLKFLNNLSNRKIQTITGVSRNSVANYVNSFNEMNLSLEHCLKLNDKELEQLFHPQKPSYNKQNSVEFDIDWNKIHCEQSSKGVTRKLLYEELLANNP